MKNNLVRESRLRRGVPLVLLFLFSSWFGTSCSNSTEPPPVAKEVGRLIGFVSAFRAGSADTISPVGINVTLQGTAFHGVTDASGQFEIADIPAGVYNIIFAKQGFDSMVYPAHHLVGAGTDIINDAFLIQASTDSIALKTISAVFTVSISKTIHVIDTIFKDSAGVIDTIVLKHDSVSISYDTVANANALVISGKVTGALPPGDLFVYSSLDSAMFPWAGCPMSPRYTEDAWLGMHLTDSTYHRAFQSPRISGGVFIDTLSSDVRNLSHYSLPAGAVVYIFVVGHSNTAGLPVTTGQYAHYFTTPYGPEAIRFRYVVP